MRARSDSRRSATEFTTAPRPPSSCLRRIPPSNFSIAPNRVIKVASDELALPDDLAERIANEVSDFVIDEEVLAHAVSALVTGHVILQGPPGTGKSDLAQRLARALNARLEI